MKFKNSQIIINIIQQLLMKIKLIKNNLHYNLKIYYKLIINYK